jgi:hypothetical protein
MQPPRFILAALTVLAWIISSNSCLLAATFAPKLDVCCHEESGLPDSGGSEPCGASECDKCVTLESGINVSVLIPLAAPAPNWMEDSILSQELVAVLFLCVRELPLEPPIPRLVPRTWCEVVKKALPVRGPSLSA